MVLPFTGSGGTLRLACSGKEKDAMLFGSCNSEIPLAMRRESLSRLWVPLPITVLGSTEKLGN